MDFKNVDVKIDGNNIQFCSNVDGETTDIFFNNGNIIVSNPGDIMCRPLYKNETIEDTVRAYRKSFEWPKK